MNSYDWLLLKFKVQHTVESQQKYIFVFFLLVHVFSSQSSLTFIIKDGFQNWGLNLGPHAC